MKITDPLKVGGALLAQMCVYVCMSGKELANVDITVFVPEKLVLSLQRQTWLAACRVFDRKANHLASHGLGFFLLL